MQTSQTNTPTHNINNFNFPPERHIKVLDGQGWIGLVNVMGDETTIVNAARVSFGKFVDEMSEKDLKLLHYLIQHRHTSPFEHVVFTFLVHCPLFVRSQWHRHRTWSYNEISRRYTEVDIEFYVPTHISSQSESNKQASTDNFPKEQEQEVISLIKKANQISLEIYEELRRLGVCREQSRGVLTQNLMTTFWATVDLHNLIHFLELRDHDGAQWEIRQYARAIKKLIPPFVPNIAKYYKW